MYKYKNIKKYNSENTNPNYADCLIGSVFTEKTTKQETEKMIVSFWVKNEATKPLIKAAIEKLFSTKVIYVHIINVPGKSKRSRMSKKQKNYRMSDKKKAIIRLASMPNVSEIL